MEKVLNERMAYNDKYIIRGNIQGRMVQMDKHSVRKNPGGAKRKK